MTNPLTSLDELIWKQFEKVTQYAHKNYGWDKWDLAQTTDTGSGVALVGLGIYSIAAGLVGSPEAKPSPTALLGIGTFCSALGFSIPYVSRKMNHAGRYLEMSEILRTGASKFLYFGPERPLSLLLFSSLIGKGIGGGSTAENDYEIASSLVLFAAGAIMTCRIVSDYFRSQLPTPPFTRKPFWRTVYEGMKNKFKSKERLEPATEPAQNYGTIDAVVT